MTQTNVPAPVLSDFTAGIAFQIDIGIGAIRPVEVGANAVFDPGAA